MLSSNAMSPSQIANLELNNNLLANGMLDPYTAAAFSINKPLVSPSLSIKLERLEQRRSNSLVSNFNDFNLNNVDPYTNSVFNQQAIDSSLTTGSLSAFSSTSFDNNTFAPIDYLNFSGTNLPGSQSLSYAPDSISASPFTNGTFNIENFGALHVNDQQFAA